jgi:hypothetical protein
MKTRAIAISLCLALLAACNLVEPRPPSIERSTIRISIAQRGDLQAETGALRNVVYIEKPPLASPNAQGILFVADNSERHATAVRVTFGQGAGKFVEIKHGINPGDHVITSDMSAIEDSGKIDLR